MAKKGYVSRKKKVCLSFSPIYILPSIQKWEGKFEEYFQQSN